MSPITGISEGPLGTGRPFATSPSAASSGELFARDLDAALGQRAAGDPSTDESSAERAQSEPRAERAQEEPRAERAQEEAVRRAAEPRRATHAGRDDTTELRRASDEPRREAGLDEHGERVAAPPAGDEQSVPTGPLRAPVAPTNEPGAPVVGGPLPPALDSASRLPEELLRPIVPLHELPDLHELEAALAEATETSAPVLPATPVGPPGPVTPNLGSVEPLAPSLPGTPLATEAHVPPGHEAAAVLPALAAAPVTGADPAAAPAEPALPMELARPSVTATAAEALPTPLPGDLAARAETPAATTPAPAPDATPALASAPSSSVLPGPSAPVGAAVPAAAPVAVDGPLPLETAFVARPADTASAPVAATEELQREGLPLPVPVRSTTSGRTPAGPEAAAPLADVAPTDGSSPWTAAEARSSAAPSAAPGATPGAQPTPVAEAPLFLSAEPAAAPVDPAAASLPAQEVAPRAVPTGRGVLPTAEGHAEAMTRTFADAALDPAAPLSTGATSASSAASGTGPAPELPLVERADAVLRQIRMHVQPGAQSLTLQLEPVELGRLLIRMSMQQGRLVATVRAERTETLEALESRVGELRDLLAERGVDAEAIRLELGFGQQRSTNDGGFEPHLGETPGTNDTETASGTDEEPQRSALAGSSSEDGIDTYA